MINQYVVVSKIKFQKSTNTLISQKIGFQIIVKS